MFLVASCKPEIYMNDYVMNAMIGIIRRDVTAGLKGINKTNPYVHQSFLNLLAHAFADVSTWPETFLKVIFLITCIF